MLFKKKKTKYIEDLIMEEKFSNFLPFFLKFLASKQIINFQSEKKEIILKTYYLKDSNTKTLVLQYFVDKREELWKKIRFTFNQDENSIHFEYQQDYIQLLLILLDFIKMEITYSIFITSDILLPEGHKFGPLYQLLMDLKRSGIRIEQENYHTPEDNISIDGNEGKLTIKDGFVFFNSITLSIFKVCDKPIILF
jgi:hypothetical protein